MNDEGDALRGVAPWLAAAAVARSVFGTWAVLIVAVASAVSVDHGILAGLHGLKLFLGEDLAVRIGERVQATLGITVVESKKQILEGNNHVQSTRERLDLLNQMHFSIDKLAQKKAIREFKSEADRPTNVIEEPQKGTCQKKSVHKTNHVTRKGRLVSRTAKVSAYDGPATQTTCIKDCSLEAFLDGLDLAHYLSCFKALGAEKTSHLFDLGPSDLDDIGLKLLEKRRLLRGIEDKKKCVD